MMRFTYLIIVLLGYLFPGHLLAQDKARITITRELNGKTIVETREINLSDGQDIGSVLRDMGVTDESGTLKDGQRFEIQLGNWEHGTSAAPDNSSSNLPPPIPFSSPIAPLEFHPYLGITMRDALLPGKGEGAARITEVDPASPAGSCGLQAGDLITHINGVRTERAEEVAIRVRSQKPGDELKLQILRDGRKKVVRAILSDRISESTGPVSPFLTPGMDEGGPFFLDVDPDSILLFLRDSQGVNLDSCLRLAQPFDWSGEGFVLGEMAFLGVTPGGDCDVSGQGVSIGSVDENSCAQTMGLQPGDIIVRAGGVDVRTFDELAEVIQDKNPGDAIEIIYLRNGREREATGKLGSRPASTSSDFRIFHDFKGMDDVGQLLYDYEFDMDFDDLRRELDSLWLGEGSYENRNEDWVPASPDDPESMDHIHMTIEMDRISDEELDAFHAHHEEVLSNTDTFIPQSLAFFPDPGQGTLRLSFTSADAGDLSVTLFSAAGGMVFEERIMEFSGSYTRELALYHHPYGTYYLQIRVGDKSFCRKLIKAD